MVIDFIKLHPWSSEIKIIYAFIFCTVIILYAHITINLPRDLNRGYKIHVIDLIHTRWPFVSLLVLRRAFHHFQRCKECHFVK